MVRVTAESLRIYRRSYVVCGDAVRGNTWFVHQIRSNRSWRLFADGSSRVARCNRSGSGPLREVYESCGCACGREVRGVELGEHRTSVVVIKSSRRIRWYVAWRGRALRGVVIDDRREREGREIMPRDVTSVHVQMGVGGVRDAPHRGGGGCHLSIVSRAVDANRLYAVNLIPRR